MRSTVSNARLARYLPAIQKLTLREMLLHKKISDGMGLSATSYRCFRLMAQLGPMSATMLARESGMSLDAVGPIVATLEDAGCLIRVRDVNDRRRLVLAADPDAMTRSDVLADARPMEACLEAYDNHDFEVVMTFLNDLNGILEEMVIDNGMWQGSSMTM